MTQNQIEATVKEHTDFWIDLANEIYNKTMQKPKILFNLRGKTAAGAWDWKWLIKINLVLLKENWQDMIDDTIPHEVAHLVAYKIYGSFIKPHGTEWKSVMRNFGKNPIRCHKYNTSNSTLRTVAKIYTYECSCKTYNLTIIRHRRQASGQKKYFCKKCRYPIKFIGVAA